METKKNTHPHVVRWLALMVCLLASSWVHAVPQSGSWAARSISLGDLGLVKPVTLNQQMRERHFYFPIAQNIALKDAYIDLDLTYLRQFSGEDGLTILLIRPLLSVNQAAYFTRGSWKYFLTRSGDFSS
ncbi:MAG: hypothetical protein HKM00_08870, partial [Gallionella sp.]|nr:hypothetical protein [Gallionella sp.]